MTSNKERNKMYNFYYGLSKAIYILGGPNYWPKQLILPNWFHKMHKPVSIFMYTVCISTVALEWGALFTQTDLSEKQKCDLFILAPCHLILYCFMVNATYYAKTVKKVFKNFALDFKIFDDKQIERDTIKRIRYYYGFCTCLFCSALIMYGINGCVQVFMNEGTFTTIITAWPHVNDHSKAAGVARVFAFISFWILGLRSSAVSYLVIIPVTICLSHQYKNLRSYFYSLKDIFEGNEDQKEKEQKYEQGFKIGIQWHADILRCIKLAQKALALVFGGQIILNVLVQSILFLQFVNAERTLPNTFTTITSAGALLISTGCFVWNAGDISVEALALPKAMFESGWHNCRTEASAKVRPMITIAMCQSQRPVQLRCFGVIEVSYESYLKILKFSYSIFSVFY